MTTTKQHLDETEKILKGLDLAYERLIEFKKAKNSPLVIMRNNQVIRITAEEAEAEWKAKREKLAQQEKD